MKKKCCFFRLDFYFYRSQLTTTRCSLQYICTLVLLAMSFFDKEADLFSAFDGSSSKNKRSKPDNADIDDGPRKKARLR
jgi:hypothetical protein